MLISSFAFAADQSALLRQPVREFYTAYMHAQPLGVPAQKDIHIFEPWISSSLKSLLIDASHAEEEYRKKTKGESPPLIEGDIFTSLFEGATGFTIISTDMKSHSCVVEFIYDDPSGMSKQVKWKDKVFCVHESSGWKIDDIEYGGTWQFMHKGKLKDLLRDAINNQ